MNRQEAIKEILSKHKGALFVISNGLTSREACYFYNQDSNFYLLHAMGEAVSVAAGLSSVLKDREIVVIDGDGNTLMGLSSLIFLQRYNLKYYVLANGTYATTGGQELPKLPSWVYDIATVYEIDRSVRTTPNPQLPQVTLNNFKNAIRGGSRE